MGWIVLVVIALICIIPSYVQYKKREEIEKKAAEVERNCKIQGQSKYEIAKKKVSFPETMPNIVTLVDFRGGRLYFYWKYYVWKRQENLCFFPASIHGDASFTREKGTMTLEESKYIVKEIPLDKIMFYRQIGEVYTTVSGSGGGSAYSPITGVHGKILPIKIESEVHDERSTQLFYDDGMNDCVLVFKDNDYYALRKVIPEKDYQVVTNSLSFAAVEDNSMNKLQKLKEMREKDLITEEDYQKKKKEILDTI